MKRRHLFEIEDQKWCPPPVRDTLTDFLQFNLSATGQYSAILPLLAAALQRARTHRVLDLCSGGGGPWLSLHPALAEQGMNVKVCLTDKYPNLAAFKRSRRVSNRAIDYHPTPVDATRVPGNLPGFRTLFTAFHHFRPEQARAVLADAVRQRQGIGVFEIPQRSIAALLLVILVPLAVLFSTPFIRPFRWSRLFWTYVIPLSPLVTLFDGIVSCLRAYTVPELHNLAQRLNANGYYWDIGTVKSGTIPLPVTYLIGVPEANGRTGSLP